MKSIVEQAREISDGTYAASRIYSDARDVAQALLEAVKELEFYGCNENWRVDQHRGFATVSFNYGLDKGQKARAFLAKVSK